MPLSFCLNFSSLRLSKHFLSVTKKNLFLTPEFLNFSKSLSMDAICCAPKPSSFFFTRNRVFYFANNVAFPKFNIKAFG